MPKKRSAYDLSDDELRWLLVEKRRAIRQERLEEFRRTGRVAKLAAEIDNTSIEHWHAGELFEDGMGVEKSRGKRILDLFLLVVEIAAVIGFIVILLSGLNILRELNQEVVSAMDEQPTMTATPLIMAVVLPSGHTPPNSAGGAQFNEAEIPAHLKPFVQSLANLPAPTPAPEQAIRIQIPAINVDAPIVQGDGWDQLKKGVGQNIHSVNPGESGNIILSAHNDIYGEIFRDLDKLKRGDKVIIFSNQRAYTYIVTNSQIVEPTAVEFMAPTKEPTVTLISCYPYMKDTKRIVVTAKLQESK